MADDNPEREKPEKRSKRERSERLTVYLTPAEKSAICGAYKRKGTRNFNARMISQLLAPISSKNLAIDSKREERRSRLSAQMSALLEVARPQSDKNPVDMAYIAFRLDVIYFLEQNHAF